MLYSGITMLAEHDMGMDEWWCRWFRCPVCGVDHITALFHYCPECGVRLNWKEYKDGR